MIQLTRVSISADANNRVWLPQQVLCLRVHHGSYSDADCRSQAGTPARCREIVDGGCRPFSCSCGACIATAQLNGQDRLPCDVRFEGLSVYL